MRKILENKNTITARGVLPVPFLTSLKDAWRRWLFCFKGDLSSREPGFSNHRESRLGRESDDFGYLGKPEGRAFYPNAAGLRIIGGDILEKRNAPDPVAKGRSLNSRLTCLVLTPHQVSLY